MRRPHLGARSKATILGGATLLLVVIGIVLVITGGDERPTAPTTTAPRPGAATRPTLDLDHTSAEAVAAMAGLSLPAGVRDFLTASTEDRTQLDVSFTLPADQVTPFVADSKLTTPVEGRRVITHSSPLWKVNPDGRVSGAADVHAGVTRAVETVPEGDRVRVRIVLTPT